MRPPKVPEPAELIAAVEMLSQRLREASTTITTVESCTGGLVGASITAMPGSSDIYPGGFITYSNALKHTMVGVLDDTLGTHGAVSPQTAIEMARGGQHAAQADYALAITGIAGPGGETETKPVGTVWICASGPNSWLDCRRFRFPGDRGQVRHQSCLTALLMADQAIDQATQTLPHEQERFGA